MFKFILNYLIYYIFIKLQYKILINYKYTFILPLMNYVFNNQFVCRLKEIASERKDKKKKVCNYKL